jgi:hypothetical protein
MTVRHSSELTSARRGRLLIWIALAAALVGGAFVYRFMRPKADADPLVPGRRARLGPEVEAGVLPCFRDMTAQSGVQFTYRNGEEADQFTILESLGGGLALIDYDNDGLLDLFITGGGFFDGPDKHQIKGVACKLYKNLGGWKFKDVTHEAGLDLSWWYTHGASVADYDRDGWPDLLVTGYGKLGLFHNEPDGKGSRHFVDVTKKMGLSDDGWTTGAGWADLDGDGFPEVYLCRYTDWSFANNPPCVGQMPGITRDVCPPHRFKPLVHALYGNDKGQSFRNVSVEHGFKAEGYGLGVVLADICGAGRPDIYVTNDMTRNFLYCNRGGKLEEKAIVAGVAVDDVSRATASMGVDASDYDGSGRAALFVTNFQNEVHSLYRNLGQDLFYYQSPAAGLCALSREYVGWGTGFIDFDNDGWEDLAIVNGHLFRHPAGAALKQPPVLLRNVEQQGRRVFKDASKRGGAHFQTPAVGRGLAIGDLDNDGWPDLVISNINSPVVLLRNEGATGAPETRWLGVKLIGRGGRDVVGSTAILEGNTRTLTRFAKGGGSYLSSSDRRLLFGLGVTELVRCVKVRWSWGKTQSWDHLEPGHYYELHEGQPKAKRIN